MKRIRKIASRIPYLKERREIERLKSLLSERDVSLQHKEKVVSSLERRNDEWAREVRELRHQDEVFEIIWPVAKEDLINANLERPTIKNKQTFKPISNKKFAWIIPPVGKISGGHTTILRLVEYLDSHGYLCDLYIYDPQKSTSLKENLENLKGYPPVKGQVFYNTFLKDVYSAAFATSWHTAYPLYNAHIAAKKFYFVQDFEPFFDPVGSYSTLAENTYKFGFFGLAMGTWLSDKLINQYGMAASGFNLGYNPNEYFVLDANVPRNKILFYARPVTPRRGFELGVLALEIFSKKHPEYEIHFIGWDISRYNIPFNYVNHGILNITELNELYNQCAAGLVLSFTNMSLLPLELRAAGCIPVVNEAEHTIGVPYKDVIEFSAPFPQAIADTLERAANKYKSQSFTIPNTDTWDAIFSQIEKTISQQLHQ